MVTIAKPQRPINLLRGWPAPSLHPTEALAAAAQTAFSDPAVSTPALQYGPDDGYPPLRAAISAWLAEFYGAPDDVNRICITGGASQNLACALQVFTDPNVTKRIWMVAPTYYLASNVFEDAGFKGRLRAVKEDEEGVDVKFLESELEKLVDEKPSGPALKPDRPWRKTYDHIIYAVPTFANPSGKTMSLARRSQLVHIARKYNALIITDDVYDFLQWPTTFSSSNTEPSTSTSPSNASRALLPRLTDIDRTLPPHPSDPSLFGHTLSNASFSKIVGPGVRTGWVDAAPRLSFGISQTGSSRSGGCPSQLVASFLTELVRTSALQKHIATSLVPSYQRRHAVVMRAIAHALVPLGVQISHKSLAGHEVFGGYFVWFQLPRGVSAEVLAEKALRDEALVVSAGRNFEVRGDEDAAQFDEWIRVCFSWVDEDDLEEGIKRLGRVLREVLEGSEGI